MTSARARMLDPPRVWARYTGRRSGETARSSWTHRRYLWGSWGSGRSAQSPSGSTPSR